MSRPIRASAIRWRARRSRPRARRSPPRTSRPRANFTGRCRRWIAAATVSPSADLSTSKKTLAVPTSLLSTTRIWRRHSGVAVGSDAGRGRLRRGHHHCRQRAWQITTSPSWTPPPSRRPASRAPACSRGRSGPSTRPRASNATQRVLSAADSFTRTIGAPAGTRRRRHSGARQLIVSWDPKDTAKNYTVQFSTDPASAAGSSTRRPPRTPSFAPLLSTGASLRRGWHESTGESLRTMPMATQGRWSAAQTLVMPQSDPSHRPPARRQGQDDDSRCVAKIRRRQGHRGRQRQGRPTVASRPRPSRPTPRAWRASRSRPTKSGCQIKFTALKTGLIGTTLNVYGF